MNNATSSALCLIGLGAAMAYAVVSRTSAPESLPPISEVVARPAIEDTDIAAAPQSRPLDSGLFPPEPTTVIVASLTTLREVRLSAPIAVPSERIRLVRELQRELKRLGCYSHEINGEWTPGTRAAMKDFTDRVNAVLPLEKPDTVLLALLQSHDEIVCGNTCPAGQSLVKNNRCLPNALVAAKPERTEMTRLASTASPSGPPAEASVSPPAAAALGARARRPSPRPNPSGSGIFGILGW